MHPRARRTTITMLLAGGAMLSLTGGALAANAAPLEAPVNLGGDVFVDRTGTVSASNVAGITQHLEQNNASSNADVYAVVVDSFDGMSQDQWATESARASNLGQDAMLLAIAVDDNSYAYTVANAYPRTNAQVQSAIQTSLVPAYRNGDLPGAINGFSDAIAENVAASSNGQGASGVDPAALGMGLAGIGGVAALGGGAWLVSRGVRRRREQRNVRAAHEREQLSLEELKQRADIALVQLDDTVQQSDQELAFAEAQFGAQPVAEYRAALDKAKGGLAEAFGLQQQLDDAFPDSDEDRHAWSSRILQIAQGATAELASHAKGFDELRNLEHTAPQALDTVTASRASLDERIAGGKRILDALDDEHAGSSIDPVRKNIAGAEQLLPVIDESITTGRAAVRDGDGAKAALAVHAAEAALAQANGLLAGVERARTDLATASQQLRELVDDTVADIARAQSLPKTQTDLAPLVRFAEEGIRAARHVPTDTLTVLAQLQRANQALDEATGQVRSAADAAQRAQSSLGRWIDSARANIDQAEQFILTRRMGVGSRARQYLSVAQQELAQALQLQQRDPQSALQQAESASRHAQAALEMAQSDVDGFGGASQNPYYRGGGRGQDMLTGGLMGYILGGMLGGGGHSGYDHGGGGGLGDIFGGGGGFSGGGGGFFGGGGGFSGGGGGFGGGGGDF